MCVFQFGSNIFIWRFSYKIFCCVDWCWHLGVSRVTELESWLPSIILIMFVCYVSEHAWPLHALLHSMFCIISTPFCWVNSFHQISTCLNCWCLSYAHTLLEDWWLVKSWKFKLMIGFFSVYLMMSCFVWVGW